MDRVDPGEAPAAAGAGHGQDRLGRARGAATGHPTGPRSSPEGEGTFGVLSTRDHHITRKQKKQSLILAKPNNIMYID